MAFRELHGVRLASTDVLSHLSGAAREKPRLRANANFHEMSDPVHRFLNAIEPGSYVRPHRHAEPPRAETLVAVSGSMGLLVFDGAGRVVGTVVLAPGGETPVADIPAGVFHSLVGLLPGSVVLEVKAGPYLPPGECDLAPFAPAEGEAAAVGYLSGLRGLFASP